MSACLFDCLCVCLLNYAVEGALVGAGMRVRAHIFPSFFPII